MIPNREGIFHAYPREIGIDETGPNNLTTAIINFEIFEEKVQGEFYDIAGESLNITGYFYLEKRDGALNSFTIDSLKSVLGWDGRDPFWMQDTDLSQHPVQLTLEYEEYNGKTSIKVKWLNPYGSTGGGVTKADDTKRNAITNRLGSKLRANAGGTPANAPQPSEKPAPPSSALRQTAPGPGKKATSTPAIPLPECTMQDAWAEFTSHMKKEDTQEQVESEWFRIIQSLFGDKPTDKITPAEWFKMKAECPALILPF